jgi:hypothetical protein
MTMAEAETYIRNQDREEYRRFCMHHIPSFARAPPDEIWHTTADGLIGIPRSGQIWSTQIACLNDTLEQRYFGDLVQGAVKARRAANTDPALDLMWRAADEGLSDRNFSAAGHFVACFSEVEDDLGQWRGYGGGECGYAIGFRSKGILDAIKGRGNTLLLPMNYDEKKHNFLVDDVLRVGQTYYLDGVKRGLPNLEKWARKFVIAFATELDIFACVIKHPKFSGEAERRITTLLQADEHGLLEFRKKRTLLDRHLPLALPIAEDAEKRPPITRICIGPGPSQQVSKISVGDLLLKHGYANIPVELSKVPYRVP